MALRRSGHYGDGGRRMRNMAIWLLVAIFFGLINCGMAKTYYTPSTSTKRDRYRHCCYCPERDACIKKADEDNAWSKDKSYIVGFVLLLVTLIALIGVAIYEACMLCKSDQTIVNETRLNMPDIVGDHPGHSYPVYQGAPPPAY